MINGLKPPDQHIVLNDDSTRRLTAIPQSQVGAPVQASIKRLVEVLDWTGNELIVRRNRFHRVGRVVLGNTVLTVPPSLPPDVFVDLYLYATTGTLSRFEANRPVSVDLSRSHQDDSFLRLLGLIYSRLLEDILMNGVARLYQPKTERLQSIKGRPLWAADFGKHPSLGVTCLRYEISTDNLPNQLLLAGAEAASRALIGTQEESHLLRQAFIWKSLAASRPVTSALFDRAQQQLNRLTMHYAQALSLARAFTLGFIPEDVFDGQSDILQTLEFSLPLLFEEFAQRLISSATAQSELTVQSQRPDGHAIVDGTGQKYRGVRPDIVVFRKTEPRLIIDAKYKPRYLSPANASGQIDDANKVSSEDIYQLCFYQARLRSEFGLTRNPSALIVAPRLSTDPEPSHQALRTLTWHGGDRVPTEVESSLTVAPLVIDTALREVRRGAVGIDLLRSSPEIQAALTQSALP